MPNNNFKDKLARFLEEEKKASVDKDLLDKLHGFLVQDTLYWSWDPEYRNTLNAFFKDLHSQMESELLSGRYGASIIIDSMIVTAFEVGLRLGIDTQVGAVQKKIESER